jgi:hypothetical protein
VLGSGCGLIVSYVPPNVSEGLIPTVMLLIGGGQFEGLNLVKGF